MMTDAEAQLKKALRKKRKVGRFPKMNPPLRQEREYMADLRAITDTLSRLIEKILIPRLENIQARFYLARPELARKDHAPSPVFRKDGMDFVLVTPADGGEVVRIDVDDIFGDTIDRIRAGVEEAYSQAEIRRIARKRGISVAQFNAEVLVKSLKRVAGIDVFAAEPWLAQEIELFTIANTNLITSLRDRALADVQTKILEGFRAGVRHEEIAKDIMDFVDPSTKGGVRERANFIARDQVAKLNGQLTELRQTTLGIAKYIWRTSLDERVRETHRAKEGKVFRWDDPPPDTGHPGEDYNCRCSAEPYLEDLLGEDFASSGAVNEEE